MAGILICRTPAISFTEKYVEGLVYFNDSVPWNVTKPSETGYAFCLSIGAGIGYHITKKIVVLLSGSAGTTLNTINVTYNSTFNSTISSYININQVPVPNYYSNLRIQINNLQMGVGYEF